jgi:hypothetical protein
MLLHLLDRSGVGILDSRVLCGGIVLLSNCQHGEEAQVRSLCWMLGTMGHVAPVNFKALVRGITFPQDDAAADELSEAVLSTAGARARVPEEDGEGLTAEQILRSDHRERLVGLFEGFTALVTERLRELSMESTQQRLSEVMRFVTQCFERLEVLSRDAATMEGAAANLSASDPQEVSQATATIADMRQTYPFSAAAADEKTSKALDKSGSKIAEDRGALREKEKEQAKGNARIGQADIFESVKLLEKEVSGAITKEAARLRDPSRWCHVEILRQQLAVVVSTTQALSAMLEPTLHELHAEVRVRGEVGVGVRAEQLA